MLATNNLALAGHCEVAVLFSGEGLAALGDPVTGIGNGAQARFSVRRRSRRSPKLGSHLSLSSPIRPGTPYLEASRHIACRRRTIHYPLGRIQWVAGRAVSQQAGMATYATHPPER
jgi:hypothetical protein